MKIKKLKTSNNKAVKLGKNLEALIYDVDNYLTNQNLGLFMKKNSDGFVFRPMNKYVKLYEKTVMPQPEVENIIPRRRAIRRIIKNKSAKNKKN